MASVTVGISPAFTSNLHSETARRYRTGSSATYKSTGQSSYTANLTNYGPSEKSALNYQSGNHQSSRSGYISDSPSRSGYISDSPSRSGYSNIGDTHYEVSNLASSRKYGGSLNCLSEESYLRNRVQNLVDTSSVPRTPPQARHSFIYDRETTPRRSFAKSSDRYYGKSVDPDVLKEISRDLKRAETSKVSRFQKTFAPQAIKRKVEEVFTRKSKAESLVTPNVNKKTYSKDDLSRDYDCFDYRTMYDGVGRLSKSNVVSYEDANLVNKVLQRAQSGSEYSDYRHDPNSSYNTPSLKSSPSPIIPRKTPRLLTNSDHIEFNRNDKDTSLIKGFENANLNFIPDSVNVTVLPSGKKAIEYSTSSQSGTGNQKEANALIERIVQKTKIMQQTMTSLEEFVRRNRSLFPEETQIFQRIRFFQLTDEQLKEIGEKPGAEIYGVKITEKLVVPRGTDISNLLGKYYGKNEVQVCYEGGKEGILIKDDDFKLKSKKPDKKKESYNEYLQKVYREKIELSREKSEKSPKTKNRYPHEIETADNHVKHHSNYNHLHPYVSGAYIKSIYSDSGLNYDDIYTPGKTSYASSVTSDRESTRSTRSSRRGASSKKRFDTAPTFTSTLRSKNCMASQNIRFNCSVSGLPLPDVTWSKGNRILSDGPRIKITNNYGLLSLEINDVIPEDSGNYTVAISNLEGESSCCATLQVQDVHIGDLHKVAQKPYFISDATNTYAEIGGKGTFEVQAGGNPTPNFKWTKDCFTLEESDHYHMFMDDRGNSKLIINKVLETDAGLYSCIASSKVGSVKVNATLVVVPKGQLSGKRSRDTTPTGRRSFSRERTPLANQEIVPEGTKPYFMKKPPNVINVKEGDPIFVNCIIDGDPKPAVTWLKGARELSYTQRMRVMVSGDHYTLNMTAALQTDPGQYTCVASNRCGSVQTNVWINVLPRGKEEPDDWELTHYKMEHSDAYIEKIRTTKSENIAPKFTMKLPREIEIIEGDDLDIDCKEKETEPKTREQIEYRMRESAGVKIKEEKLRISTKVGDEAATVLESKIILDTSKMGKDQILDEENEESIIKRRGKETTILTGLTQAKVSKPVEDEIVKEKPKSQVLEPVESVIIDKEPITQVSEPVEAEIVKEKPQAQVSEPVKVEIIKEEPKAQVAEPTEDETILLTGFSQAEVSEPVEAKIAKEEPKMHVSEPVEAKVVKEEPKTQASEPVEAVITKEEPKIQISEPVKAEIITEKPQVQVSEPVEAEIIKEAPQAQVSEPVEAEIIKEAPQAQVSEPVEAEIIKEEPQAQISEPVEAEIIKEAPQAKISELVESEIIKDEPQAQVSEPVVSEIIKEVPQIQVSEPVVSEIITEVPQVQVSEPVDTEIKNEKPHETTKEPSPPTDGVVVEKNDSLNQSEICEDKAAISTSLPEEKTVNEEIEIKKESTTQVQDDVSPPTVVDTPNEDAA